MKSLTSKLAFLGIRVGEHPHQKMKLGNICLRESALRIIV